MDKHTVIEYTVIERRLNMKKDDEIKILTERDYLVVKGNDLVQRSRFELSLAEQKTVAYICSLIKPAVPSPKTYGVPYQLEYDFDIREYCKVCEFDYDAGKNYGDVKRTLKKLRDRSMWLKMGDRDVLTGWLAKAETNKRSGLAKIKLDEDMVPFLFALQERFTQYHLYNILAMKSAYSVRIYELMKSYLFQRSKVFKLDELKRLLMVDEVASYKRYPDFRRFVLDVAMKEINELTDIKVSYDALKEGRRMVVKIEFVIQQKTPMERWKSGEEVNKRLDDYWDIEPLPGQIELAGVDRY
jgi:plasmid replication initiation protein